MASRLPIRYMTIVAQDPSVTRGGRILTARVAVPAEDLLAGPRGYRTHVVDYDSTRHYFHGSHILPASYEEEPPGWREGRKGVVDDFRFHAQNVYALVMKTLARFEFALGRRLGWSFDTHQLKIAPHGMFDANAFYSPVEEGLVFGYFKGLSGKRVYTSLSHDVVVHETTHALLDGLRERYLVPSNPDQAAFHEGFADVIALLSVFALPEVVAHLLVPASRGTKDGTRTIARKAIEPPELRQSALFGLAKQMGTELDGLRGSALRRSAELEPNAAILDDPEFSEPHRRGEIFVAAVMQAFVEAWSKRIKAAGLDGQQAFPLASVVEEGADIADALATLWIRALDYMPPVHLTFRDALTAALTSDTQVRPDDERFKLRHYLKAQFAAYGILPVAAKNAQPDCWAPAPKNLRYDRVRFESMRSDKDEVFRFLWENQRALGLQTDAYAKVLSVRPCLRTGVDGFVLRETVAEYYQVARLTPSELAARKIPPPPEYVAHLKRVKAERDARRAARTRTDARAAALSAHHDGDESEATPPDTAVEDDETLVTAVYGGGVLIFDEYGRLKYHVHNRIFGSQQKDRLKYLWESGLLSSRVESAGYRAARLSTLHRMRSIDARKFPSEGW